MPIIIPDKDAPQGGPEWIALRLGIPTASHFSEIVTPLLDDSQSAPTLRNRLLAERLTGESEQEYTSTYMARGFEMQPRALAWYAAMTDCDVEAVSLIFLDETRRIAASPDGLIGENGGVETKCPSGGVHVEFLLTSTIPQQYWPQVYGNLWVSGRAWWDYVSFHPKMPSGRVRVYRDGGTVFTYTESEGRGKNKVVTTHEVNVRQYMRTLADRVQAFADELDQTEKRLRTCV